MSRSRRSTPIVGNTRASSERHDKRVANRRDRRVNREILSGSHDDSRLVDRKATSNPWSMAKDGKHFIGHSECPELMRK